MMFSRSRQRGFSLIEVMVAMGVAAVLTYAIAQMLLNSGKQASSVASKSDFNSFVNQLQGAFNNTNTCLAALGGPNGTTLPDPAIPKNYPFAAKLSMGGATYSALAPNNTYGGPSAGITGVVSKRALKITHLDFQTPNPATAKNQWVVPLVLTVDRSVGKDSAVGGNTLTKTFNLILTVNPVAGGLSIVGCAGQYTDFWSSTGDTGEDIIYSGGNVAIGYCPNNDHTNPLCVDPPQAALDVGGEVQATAFMWRSDARLKENVREIPGALDRVLKLHGVLFDWKGTAGKNKLGLIAQEVEQVFPEAVTTNTDGMKAVAYANLLAPVVEAFKEQRDLIQKQEREIAELKAAVQSRKGNGQ